MRNAAVREPLLVDPQDQAQPAQAIAPRASADAMQLFERWATDPNASVEKIERLMALWERSEAKNAETAFNAAMSTAQSEMTAVAADSYNPQTKSKYASYEALDRTLRPTYTKHGFGLSFGTGDSPHELHVRVVCLVTHRDGHSRTYHIDMPADGKGAKGGDVMTRTHATGSAVSYGMRYLLKMIFNVAVGEDDDDGQRAGKKPRENDDTGSPTGYDEWLTHMEAVALKGWPALAAEFGKASDDYRKRATGFDKQWWGTVKAKAEAVTKGGAK